MTQHNKDRDRSDLLEQMLCPTRQVAEYVETALAAENQQGLLLRHDVGIRLKQVVDEKSIYGSQAVQQIAEYLGMSVDRLYKLCSYAETYSREQLEQWAAQRMRSGGRLSYNHLTTLLVIKSGEERVRLIARILEDSLSVRALRALLNQSREAPTTPKPKRKSIVSGLDQMIGRGKGLLKGFSLWKGSVFNEIDKPDRQRINPLVRNRIVEAQLMLEELSAELATAQNRLTRNLARVDQLLG